MVGGREVVSRLSRRARYKKKKVEKSVVSVSQKRKRSREIMHEQGVTEANRQSPISAGRTSGASRSAAAKSYDQSEPVRAVRASSL